MTVAATPIDIDHDLIHGVAASCIRAQVNRLLKLGRLRRSDVEDYEQELRLHVFQQVERYDPAKSSWATFVRVIVNSKCKSMLRKERRTWREGQREFSIDGQATPVEGLRGNLCGYESSGTSYESIPNLERELDCETLVGALPPTLRKLAKDLKKSTSIRQIARDRGVSPFSLYKQVRKMREQFQSLAPAA